MNELQEQVKDGIKDKIKKNKKFFKKFKWIIVSAIILAVGIGGYFTYIHFNPPKKASAERTAQVKRNNISTTITGSGAVVPISSYSIKPLVKGIITKDSFNEGDTVKQGQLLYSVDQEDAVTTIEKNVNALDKSKIDYQQSNENVSDLIVKAPISGRILGLDLKTGDSVSSNGKVATIIDDQTLKLTVPFNAADVDRIYVGQSAEINLPELMSTTSGTVARIAGGQEQVAGGMIIRNVEINVSNVGAIRVGSTATAKVFSNNGAIVCNSAGTFDYYDQAIVTANAGGTVNKLNYKDGDVVREGNVILTLDNTSTLAALQKNKIALNDSQLTLDNSKKKLSDYNITSPINGTVISKTYKQGDTLEQTNTSTVMAVIADLSKMELDINVDELDVAKIKVGQNVDITADALPKNKYKGVVDNIGLQGKSTNGVTTYPIRIIIEQPGELRPNMNVNANIVVESKENVISVPISAVRRGNVVYVKKSGNSTEKTNPSKTPNPNWQGKKNEQQSKQTQNPNASPQPTGGKQGSFFQIPEGYEMRKVETGINDQNNIEIISGLNEGDTVQLPEIKGTTPTTGGSPFGAPAGGMGGNNGSNNRSYGGGTSTGGAPRGN